MTTLVTFLTDRLPKTQLSLAAKGQRCEAKQPPEDGPRARLECYEPMPRLRDCTKETS